MSPDEYYELDAIPQWFNLEGDCGFDEERMGDEDYDPPMGCLGDEE